MCLCQLWYFHQIGFVCILYTSSICLTSLAIFISVCLSVFLYDCLPVYHLYVTSSHPAICPANTTIFTLLLVGVIDLLANNLFVCFVPPGTHQVHSNHHWCERQRTYIWQCAVQCQNTRGKRIYLLLYGAHWYTWNWCLQSALCLSNHILYSLHHRFFLSSKQKWHIMHSASVHIICFVSVIMSSTIVWVFSLSKSILL